nr:MAG TPA: hypothetical protein [Caudoviricetes sp.]
MPHRFRHAHEQNLHVAPPPRGLHLPTNSGNSRAKPSINR